MTWKKLGSTRCVGCEKLFTDQPDAEIVELEATDYAGGRPGYSANRPVRVTRRWHAVCVEAFERGNRQLRDQVEADRQAVFAMIQAQIDGEATARHDCR